MDGIGNFAKTIIENDEWPDPVPFDDFSLLPDFPVEALSGTGREMVEDVSRVNQVDPALTACDYLGVVSTCCAGKFKVDLGTHKEQPNFYLCPIYESGERKTPTMGDMTRPLYEYQKARQEAMAPAIREAQNAFTIKQRRLKQLQKKAAREEDAIERLRLKEDAAEIARTIAESVVPRPPVFLADDITPEKLGDLMAENSERMAILSAEGGLFEIIAGRYSKDGSANLDLVLKAHAGDPWSNHRIGRGAKAMEAPSLTLCLAVQPEVIEEIGRNRQFRGRGLLARFLYARCKSRVGYRTRQTARLSPLLVDNYRTHIHSLMEIPFTGTDVALTSEAQAVWDEFYNDIEREMKPGGGLERMKDWGSKLPGAVARIAALLHLSQHGAQGVHLPISVTKVTASCTIGGYFLEHAKAVLEEMREDKRIKLARQILGYIARHRPELFKGKDVIYHTGIKHMEDVTAGLKVLVDRGYLREKQADRDSARGRPEAVSYRVHPGLLKEKNVQETSK